MPIQAVIFDLDDTLFCEKDFVISGFKVVARYLGVLMGINANEVHQNLVHILENRGRGEVFDTFLAQHGVNDPMLVSTCLTLYRSHSPRIAISGEVRDVLMNLSENYSLFVVTDGNVQVQMNKFSSLGLGEFMEGILPTWALGESAGKPSLDAFDVIRKLQGIGWESLVYVGDNPYKDFVNLNLQNAITIRLISGPFADVEVPSSWDGRYRVYSLRELPRVLKEIG